MTNPYGFDWGPASVTRTMEYRGTKVICLDTDSQHLEIAVSPKGNSIRVWLNGKKLEVGV